MEAAGLAVGVIGLCGLFDATLNMIERTKSYKRYDKDKSTFKALLDGHKRSLEIWANEVGLIDGKVADPHSRHLDDEKTRLVIEALFHIINDELESIKESGATNAPTSQPAGSNGTTGGWDWRKKPPKYEKVKEDINRGLAKAGWALGGKGGWADKEKVMGRIIEQLYRLVPRDGDMWKETDRKAQKILDNQDRANAQEVHKWLMNGLSSTQSSEIYEDTLDKKLPETCKWITKMSQFRRWMAGPSSSQSPDAGLSDSSKQILWINGGPGFGKTYLSAHIVDYLKHTGRRFAYFFFSSSPPKSDDPTIVLRSWLAQLAVESKEVFDIVNKSRQGSQHEGASRQTVLKLLRDALSAITPCYLVIDGLDECDVSQTSIGTGRPPTMTEFLKMVIKLVQPHESARVLIASRSGGEIWKTLADHEAVDSLMVEASHTMDDCRLLSQHVVQEELPKKSQQIRDSIIRAIEDSCEGQLLWIRLMQSELPRYLKAGNIGTFTSQDMPRDFESFYEAIWTKLCKTPRAVELLRWVVYAIRPLTVEELTGASLAVEDSPDVFYDDFPEEGDDMDSDYYRGILDWCGQFLTIRKPVLDREFDGNVGAFPEPGPRERTVHLYHDTVRTFLLSRLPGHSVWNNPKLSSAPSRPPGEDIQKWNQKMQHRILGRLCLWFTQSEAVWEYPEEHEFHRAFGSYAVRYWHEHLELSMVPGTDDDTACRTLSFMDPKSRAWESWRQWERHCDFSAYDHDVTAHVLALDQPAFYAIALGLPLVAARLLQYINVPISPGSRESKAALLNLCCWRRHHRFVETFLDAGVDINSQDYEGVTAIATASSQGDQELVSFLVRRHADANVADHWGKTALNYSLDRAHLEIAKFLLQTGADPSRASSWRLGSTVWYCDRSLAIARTLEMTDFYLSKGVVIQGALQMAATESDIEALNFFLERGFEVNSAEGYFDLTPLLAAAFTGADPDIFKVLLSNGANVMDRITSSPTGETAIHLLAKRPTADPFNLWIDSMQLLLDYGGDVDATTSLGKNVVHYAAQAGSLKAVEFLKDKGADVQKADRHENTPLSIAAKSSHLDVVKLLVGYGANVDWNSVYSAACSGNIHVLQVLMDAGAILSRLDEDLSLLCKLLSRPATIRSELLGTIQFLVDNGVRVDAVDKGLSALYLAVGKGRYSISEFLLAKGADPNVPSNDGSTCLHVACWRGRLDLVKLLLLHGADVMKVDDAGNGALHHLSIPVNRDYRDVSAMEELVDLLVQHGLDINQYNYSGETPIHMASNGGLLYLVCHLLKKGANVMAKDKKGSEAVHHAARENPFLFSYCKGRRWSSVPILQLLIDGGADINAADNEGCTPVGVASRCNNLRAVRYLVDKGADIAAANSLGNTPLLEASLEGNFEVARYLVKKGADVHAKNRNGYTSLLSFARSTARLETIQRLIGLGASDDVATKLGETPLHFAAQLGALDTAQYLVSRGANITARTQGGLTPASLAARYGRVNMLRFLVQHQDSPGMDALLGKDGRTMLELAIRGDQLEPPLRLHWEGVRPWPVNHVGVVEYLIDDRGIDFWDPDYNGDTVLDWALRATSQEVDDGLCPSMRRSQERDVAPQVATFLRQRLTARV